MRRRGNAEGSIYERADGRWVAAVTNPSTGRQVYAYASTRAEAADKLTDALATLRAGKRLHTGKTTVAQYLGRWLDETVRHEVRSSTYTSYSSLVRLHLVPSLGRIPLTKLGPEHVQAMMNEKLNSGLSPRRVNYMRAVLRRALNDAVRWEIIGRNVATLVRPPAAIRREIRPLDGGQIRRLLDHVADDPLVAGLYTVAVSIGLRQGEVLGLQWEDLDLMAGAVHIRFALQRVGGETSLVPCKTDRSRRVLPLPEIAREALVRRQIRQRAERQQAGRRWFDSDFVFTTPKGRPLSGTSVTHRFQRHVSEAGLPRQRFHDLRHACASLLLTQGANPRVVMQILGHSQVSLTLDTYSHVMPSVEREAVNLIDRSLRRRP